MPRKPKALQMGRTCGRVSDLKVEQLAVILGQTHAVLTSQTLFSIGGELLEIHRKSLSAMKRQEDGTEKSFQMRIAVAKRMSWSEKRWHDRLVTVLNQGQVIPVLLYGGVETSGVLRIGTIDSVTIMNDLV